MGEAKPLSVSESETKLIGSVLEFQFPNLVNCPYEIKSEQTDEYNCVAWAAGDTESWWWPIESDTAFWPKDIPRILDKRYFIEAFKTLDYEECGDNFEFEIGFEKVALYLNEGNVPTHMARQTEIGIWTSKLGQGWDIVHNILDGLAGAQYGEPRLALRRPINK